MCAGRTRSPAGVSGLRVAARELDQGGRAARVVVRSRADAGVVPVRHDDDRVRATGRRRPPTGCAARRGRAREPAPASGRRRRAAYGFIWSRNHCAAGSDPGAAGRAVREPLREVVRQVQGGRAVEVRRQQRRRQRPGPRDAEREDQERQREEQEAAAVEPGVDGTLERAAALAPPRASAPGADRGCRHAEGYSKPATRWPTPPPRSCSSTTRTPCARCSPSRSSATATR